MLALAAGLRLRRCVCVWVCECVSECVCVCVCVCGVFKCHKTPYLEEKERVKRDKREWQTRVSKEANESVERDLLCCVAPLVLFFLSFLSPLLLSLLSLPWLGLCWLRSACSFPLFRVESLQLFDYFVVCFLFLSVCSLRCVSTFTLCVGCRV